MSGSGELRAMPRRIDAAAKAAFVEALRDGARREDAAEALGFSLTGFYAARARDPAFKAAWQAGLAAGPAEERRARAYDRRGEERIAPANRRLYQPRRRRHVRFDADARDTFLAHFAWSCDLEAAAAAAGVSAATVGYHCRRHPEFAGAYRAALAVGYERLEEEAVRQRLAEAERLRLAIEAAGPLPPPRLRVEMDAHFDRIMTLLARHDRKPRRPERRFAPGGRRQAWTFDMAIVALEKRLRALGLWEEEPKPAIRGAGEAEGRAE
jgi:hypothetical protein